MDQLSALSAPHRETTPCCQGALGALRVAPSRPQLLSAPRLLVGFPSRSGSASHRTPFSLASCSRPPKEHTMLFCRTEALRKWLHVDRTRIAYCMMCLASPSSHRGPLSNCPPPHCQRPSQGPAFAAFSVFAARLPQRMQWTVHQQIEPTCCSDACFAVPAVFLMQKLVPIACTQGPRQGQFETCLCRVLHPHGEPLATRSMHRQSANESEMLPLSLVCSPQPFYR